MTDYFKLRDELVNELKDIPGVLSVGLGRSGQEVVLVLTIDSRRFKGTAPQQYKGVKVNVRDLGIGVMHECFSKES